MTTAEKFYRQWFSSKSGVVPACNLVFVRQELTGGSKNGVWYECLCGGNDHCGFVPYVQEGVSQYLGEFFTCFITDQQWIIQYPDVRGTIFNEEKNYLELLGNCKKIVDKVVSKIGWSDETVKYLHETHGVPVDVAEGFRACV